MTKQLAFLICALPLVACQRQSGYDQGASAAFRAAWEKRRAGDEAGYKQALTEVAKRRGTWAGDRAALDLELSDVSEGSSMVGQLLRQAATFAGDPSRLPAMLPGSPPAPVAAPLVPPTR